MVVRADRTNGLAAFAVHARDDACRARGAACSSTLELQQRGAGLPRAGAHWALGFHEPDGPGRSSSGSSAGRTSTPAPDLGASEGSPARNGRPCRPTAIDPRPHELPAHHVVRDEAYLRWRYGRLAGARICAAWRRRRQRMRNWPTASRPRSWCEPRPWARACAPPRGRADSRRGWSNPGEELRFLSARIRGRRRGRSGSSASASVKTRRRFPTNRPRLALHPRRPRLLLTKLIFITQVVDPFRSESRRNGARR